MTTDTTRGMFDTSTVILLGRLDDPSRLPAEAVISAVTLAELSVGPHVAKTGRNPDDFAGIDALDVRPVPHPDR